MKLARSDSIYKAAVLTTLLSIIFLIFIIFSTWMNLATNRQSAVSFYKYSSETILNFIKSTAEKENISREKLFDILKETIKEKSKKEYFILFDKDLKKIYSISDFSEKPIKTSFSKSSVKKGSPETIEIDGLLFYENSINLNNSDKEALYLIYGLEMSKYQSALKADIKHSFIMIFIVAALAAGSVFFLFVIKSYREVNIMLKQAGEYTDKVVANMANGLVTIDSGGNIVSYNQSGLDLLELDKDSNIFNESVCDENVLKDTINNGRTVSEHEHIHDTKAGETHLSISVTPLEEKDTDKFGAVIIIRDLTHLKRLERKIRRTEKLAAVGRLAAVVAHEIRNPLSSIKGFGMFFANIFKSDEQKKGYAMLIVNEVDRINRVVTDLLTYSKKIDINPVKTDSNSLFDHALNLLSLEMEKKNIKVIKKITQDIPQIEVDPERIKQVLLNLIINAVDIVDNNAMIEVGSEYDEKHSKIKLWVKDSGPGIEIEKQKEIFDLFYTTREKGTGLGLAIVQKIVEYHDGTIQVESPVENNRGAKFIITLPAEESHK
jgi:two-component system sensor histidine kinase HydH